MMKGGNPLSPISGPKSVSFRAHLLANGQNLRTPVNGGQIRAPLKRRHFFTPKKRRVFIIPRIHKGVPKEDLVTKQQPNHIDALEPKMEEAAAPATLTYSSILSARSKACLVTKNIDEADRDNHLAEVEYVDALYSFYKEAEKEFQPQMYMRFQTDLNERMRAVLVDWISKVHSMFGLNLETLYLTVNIIDRFLSVKPVPKRELQLLGISALLIASKYEEIWRLPVNDLVSLTANAYNNKQALLMEKTILGNLGWYLTVPTQYVFLVRFIKASMSDTEMENMVHFLAELGMMYYDTLKFCPSMLAASAVYTARCLLNKSPAWTDTCFFFFLCVCRECSKLLALHHSTCPERGLTATHTKYSKANKGCAASFSPAKSQEP